MEIPQGKKLCPWCEAEVFQLKDGKLQDLSSEHLGIDPGKDPEEWDLDESRVKQTDDGVKVRVSCPNCDHLLVVEVVEQTELSIP